MTPKPSNPALYARVKAAASKKFESPTGVYRSAWIVREYKKRGGSFEEEGAAEPPKGRREGLKRWFAEKWIDVTTGKPCGRRASPSPRKYFDGATFPVCRPTVRVSPKTPRTTEEISPQSMRRAISQKRSNPRARVSFQEGEVSPSASPGGGRGRKLYRRGDDGKKEKGPGSRSGAPLRPTSKAGPSR